MSPEIKAKLRKVWDRVFFVICLVVVVWAVLADSESTDPKDRRMRYVTGAAFAESETVAVKMAFDSDEVIVENDYKQRTNLRLLGIRGFDANSSDPRVAYFGQLSYLHLTDHLKDQTARLETRHQKTDKDGRLLGHLHIEGNDGAYSRDIAIDLLKAGLVVVYPPHDIGDRVADYRNAESEARDAKREIWGDERALEHLALLSESWGAKQ